MIHDLDLHPLITMNQWDIGQLVSTTLNPILNGDFYFERNVLSICLLVQI